jgi:aminopeptidase N
MRRFLGFLFALLFLLPDGVPSFGQTPLGAGGQRPRLGNAQPATATAAPAAAAPVEPLRTAGDRPIDIQHIRLDLKVDLPKKTVDARAALRIRSLRPVRSITLDAVDFEVREIALVRNGDKDPVRFSQDGQKLTIDLPSPWPANQSANLVVDYLIREPKAGLNFFGPSADEPDVPLTVWSQGEPTTNRYWIPCLDQPNQRQTTELVATVAAGFEVVSNGKLLERKDNADKTVTFHWLQDKPHSSYLVTMVVGQFDVVREEWENIPVLYYVPKGRQDQVARSFGRTREMLTFFSKRFGIHYPWDKYAQVVAEQFGGGMENTSATTMGDRVLHDERSMIDGSPDGVLSSDGLIAHELAHQWWGDLVTCRDWAHIWLNEGFASYAEALWAEHAQGADEYAYNMMQKARGAISGGKTRPVVDRRYPSPGSMFDGRAYPKGAWLLHMLRAQLGDDAFWKCIQVYGNEHRLKTAETADFRRVLERETGRDLERFFYDWTERPGNPVLEVTTDYLPETKQVRVVVKQTQAGEPFHFPLALWCWCPPESGPIVSEQQATEKEHIFLISVPGRPTRVEVDPKQAVLAESKETKGRDLWRAQLQEGSTVISRIRAVQHFGQNPSLRTSPMMNPFAQFSAQSNTPVDREILAKALPAEKFSGVQIEIAKALGEGRDDACRDALIQGLQLKHSSARRACVEQLGNFARDAKAASAVKDVLQKGDPSYGVEAAALGAYAKLQQADAVAVLMPWLGKPSQHEVLRSAALSALGNTRDLSVVDTLTAWTKRGKPRECRSAALQALARLARTANTTEDQRQRMVQAITACLEGEGPRSRTRMSALFALRELGQAASSALPTLEAISQNDPNDRIRDLARSTMEQIRSNTPAPVEVSQLREEMERLKRDQEALRARLTKYEKVEPKKN